MHAIWNFLIVTSLSTLFSFSTVANAGELCADWAGECEKMEADLSNIRADALPNSGSMSWTISAKQTDHNANLILEPKDAFEITPLSDGYSFQVVLAAPQALFDEIEGNVYRLPLSATYTYSNSEISSTIGNGKSACVTEVQFLTNARTPLNFGTLRKPGQLIINPAEAVTRATVSFDKISLAPSKNFEGKTVQVDYVCSICGKLGVTAQNVTLCSNSQRIAPEQLPQPSRPSPLSTPGKTTSPIAADAPTRLKIELATGGAINQFESGLRTSEETNYPSIIVAVELLNQERFYFKVEAQMSFSYNGDPGIPYLDLRFTPYFFNPRTNHKSQALVTLLTGNISRNIYTRREYQGRIQAVAIEARSVYEDRWIHVFAEIAANAIGLNIQAWKEANGASVGVGLAEAHGRIGFVTNPKGYFNFRMMLGGLAQVNISPVTGADAELRLFTELALEFNKFFEIFVRGSLESTHRVLYYSVPANFRIVSGLGFIF